MQIHNISDVPANDVPAAIAYIGQCLSDGTWSPDKAHAILHLQDNPDALIAAIETAGIRMPTRRQGRAPRAAAVPAEVGDLSDDELDALHDLDDPHPAWDLPTEDDGRLDEDPTGQEELDEFRTDDVGYNPNRDGGGRFAPGPHHDRETHGAQHGGRSWRLAFDARAHQKAIEGHKQIETTHRAASLRIKEQLAQLRQKAEAAIPKERAAMKRHYEKLSAARDQHRAAATAAKEARIQTGKDLESARAAHSEQRKAVVADRTEAQWGRARAEAESMVAIGQHRIGGSEGAPAAGAAAHEPAPRQHVSEVGSHEAIQRGHAEAERRSAAMAAEEKTQRAAAEQHARDVQAAELRAWRPGPAQTPRQVVHYAEQKLTQQQMNERDAQRRQREIDGDQRAAARVASTRAAGTPEPAAPRGSDADAQLPPARTYSPGALDRARGFLRGLLRRAEPA